MAVSRLHAEGDSRNIPNSEVSRIAENERLNAMLQRLASLTQPAAKTPVVLMRLVGQIPALRDLVLRGLAEGLAGEPLASYQTIPEALEAVGPTPVREAALLVCYRAFCGEAVGDGAPSGRALVRNGLATASAMRLMRFYANLDTDDVFAVGLLHNVGMAGLAACRRKEYDALFATLASGSMALEQAEIDAFGFDHQDLGGALLASYGFPLIYAEVAGNHHAPLRVRNRQTESAYLCSTVAEQVGCAVGPAGQRPDLTQEEAGRFAMAPGGLDRVVAEITTAVSALDRLGL